MSRPKAKLPPAQASEQVEIDRTPAGETRLHDLWEKNELDYIPEPYSYRDPEAGWMLRAEWDDTTGRYGPVAKFNTDTGQWDYFFTLWDKEAARWGEGRVKRPKPSPPGMISYSVPRSGVDLRTLTDVDLYLRYERELTQQVRPVNEPLLASLVTEGIERGLPLSGVAAALSYHDWDELLHPRGRDGRFIEKFGWVDVFDWDIDEAPGTKYRGQVVDIAPDPDNEDRALITARVTLPDGTHREVKVSPSHVVQTAAPKATFGERREMAPAMWRDEGEEGRTTEVTPELIAELMKVTPERVAELQAERRLGVDEGPAQMVPPPDQPDLMQRLLDRVRGGDDEPLRSEVWREVLGLRKPGEPILTRGMARRGKEIERQRREDEGPRRMVAPPTAEQLEGLRNVRLPEQLEISTPQPRIFPTMFDARNHAEQLGGNWFLGEASRLPGMGNTQGYYLTQGNAVDGVLTEEVDARQMAPPSAWISQPATYQPPVIDILRRPTDPLGSRRFLREDDASEFLLVPKGNGWRLTDDSGVEYGEFDNSLDAVNLIRSKGDAFRPSDILLSGEREGVPTPAPPGFEPRPGRFTAYDKAGQDILIGDTVVWKEGGEEQVGVVTESEGGVIGITVYPHSGSEIAGQITYYRDPTKVTNVSRKAGWEGFPGHVARDKNATVLQPGDTVSWTESHGADMVGEITEIEPDGTLGIRVGEGDLETIMFRDPTIVLREGGGLPGEPPEVKVKAKGKGIYNVFRMDDGREFDILKGFGGGNAFVVNEKTLDQPIVHKQDFASVDEAVDYIQSLPPQGPGEVPFVPEPVSPLAIGVGDRVQVDMPTATAKVGGESLHGVEGTVVKATPKFFTLETDDGTRYQVPRGVVKPVPAATIPETAITREAGNLTVGDQVMLPGDLMGTVTQVEPLTGEWMRLHTDMGTQDLRMSDPIQVIVAEDDPAAIAAKKAAEPLGVDFVRGAWVEDPKDGFRGQIKEWYRSSIGGVVIVDPVTGTKKYRKIQNLRNIDGPTDPDTPVAPEDAPTVPTPVPEAPEAEAPEVPTPLPEGEIAPFNGPAVAFNDNLQPPPEYDKWSATQKNIWISDTMSADISASRDGKAFTWDTGDLDPVMNLALANTYRQAAFYDPETAQYIDGIEPGAGPGAIAVAHPGTAHVGGIGPIIKKSSIGLNIAWFNNTNNWAQNNKAIIDHAKVAKGKLPHSIDGLQADPTIVLQHEFAHHRQFRHLDIAMRESYPGLGFTPQAFTDVAQPDGFGMVPDSSNWPETQQLRHDIQKLVPTQYGRSKSSEAYAESWAARNTGNSTPELDEALDRWEYLMTMPARVPADRHDPLALRSYDDLTDDEKSAYWTTNGSLFDMTEMRDQYPDSAAKYDEWLATQGTLDVLETPGSEVGPSGVPDIPDVPPVAGPTFGAPFNTWGADGTEYLWYVGPGGILWGNTDGEWTQQATDDLGSPFELEDYLTRFGYRGMPGPAEPLTPTEQAQAKLIASNTSVEFLQNTVDTWPDDDSAFGRIYRRALEIKKAQGEGL